MSNWINNVKDPFNSDLAKTFKGIVTTNKTAEEIKKENTSLLYFAIGGIVLVVIIFAVIKLMKKK